MSTIAAIMSSNSGVTSIPAGGGGRKRAKESGKFYSIIFRSKILVKKISGQKIVVKIILGQKWIKLIFSGMPHQSPHKKVLVTPLLQDFFKTKTSLVCHSSGEYVLK